MGPDTVILFMDIITCLGFGSYYFTRLKKDIKKFIVITQIIPIAIFGTSLFLSMNEPNFLSIFADGYVTLIFGQVIGTISGMIGLGITQFFNGMVKLLLKT